MNPHTMTVKGHVFLVDDDHDIRFYLGDVLRQLGYGVTDHASAAAFLQQAQRMSPAVLVLDMRMPQMTGLELQKALNALDWHLPIIYMSGDSQNQEIIDAMKLGAIDFLWKPFTQLQMVQAIDKGLVLDAQRHADQQRLKRVVSLYEGLSPREQSMFALMLLGHGNKDIAASTGLMADTVKKHRAQVLTKMQVDRLSELIAFCKGFSPK
jgi:FixJ family two-component response regulator